MHVTFLNLISVVIWPSNSTIRLISPTTFNPLVFIESDGNGTYKAIKWQFESNIGRRLACKMWKGEGEKSDKVNYCELFKMITYFSL